MQLYFVSGQMILFSRKNPHRRRRCITVVLKGFGGLCPRFSPTGGDPKLCKQKLSGRKSGNKMSPKILGHSWAEYSLAHSRNTRHQTWVFDPWMISVWKQLQQQVLFVSLQRCFIMIKERGQPNKWQNSENDALSCNIRASILQLWVINEDTILWACKWRDLILRRMILRPKNYRNPFSIEINKRYFLSYYS